MKLRFLPLGLLALLCSRSASSGAAAEPRLHLLLTVDGVARRTAEPIVASGSPRAADFLYLKVIGPGEAVLGYDCWGAPTVVSRPFHFRPGEPSRLDLELPGIAQALNGAAFPLPRLRAWWAGTEVISAPVRFHRTDRNGLFFGVNPFGGTSCLAELHGVLASADGSPLPSASLARLHRVQAWTAVVSTVDWFAHHPRIFVPIGMLLLLALVWEPLFGSQLGADRVNWLAGAVGTVALATFALFVTGGTLRLWYADDFAAFYDAQAIALVHGHLDVPAKAIGNEAFVFRGHSYGYFGPTPSLMRLLVGGGRVLYGQWTRILMMLDFAACLIATQLILSDMVRRVRGSSARPTARSVLLLSLNVGFGSSLLFLGSRAYVYHEAILCGAAWALFSVAATLRQLDRPRPRNWVTAYILGVMAMLARPTAGLFALCALAAATVAIARRSPFRWRTWIQSGAAVAICVAGVGTLNVLSYLKFRTFDPSPFRYQVQYTPARLMRFEGKNFHLANLPLNANGYLYGPNLIIRSKFPFVFTGRPNESRFDSARFDIVEPIAALPYCMTGLCLLALVGAAAAVGSDAGQAAAILWLGAAPLTLALLTAVVMSQRYTADFCPFLAAASAVGLAALEIRPHWVRWRRIAWLATVWSMFVGLAFTWDFGGERVWGTPPGVRERFVLVQQKVDRWLNPK